MIPAVRDEAYQGLVGDLIDERRLWLSDVVVAEVMIGARNQHEQHRYDRVFTLPRQHDHVLTPTAQEWDTCGRLLSRYRQRYGNILARDHQNDVLILLSAIRSAREEETVLLTENDADFTVWLGLLRDRSGLRVQPLRRDAYRRGRP